VRVNRRPAKAATTVRVGDTVSAHLGDRERVIEVLRVIDRRVGAPIAAECIIDHSPPAPARSSDSFVFLREPAAGRPTKRDRRQLDRLRRR
jgi:ribosome-associated heat shock protein Hsp15